MSIEREHIDLFDLYLRKQLGAEELPAFENRLASDPEFKAEFDLYLLTVEGIRNREREDLKTFIRQNRSTLFWGQNIWPKRMTYAAAAVLVIFIGLYILVKFNTTSTVSSKISSVFETNEKKSSEPALQDTLYNTSKDQVAVSDQSPAPEMDSAAGLISHLSVPESLSADDAGAVADFESSPVEEKILSDVRLKDTFITLAYVEPITENINRLDNNVSNYNISSSRTKTGQIPAPYENNKRRDVPVSVSKRKADRSEETSAKKLSTDTVLLKKQEEEEDLKAPKLKTEFWKSPVNYKGYSYDGATLKLYGIEAGSFKLYLLNNLVYMKAEGTVYQIKPCPDYCPFISVNDNNTMILILNQP